jgi:CRP/FNR family transcriptional regulator, polysaccharide utilization system transcription regulator
MAYSKKEAPNCDWCPHRKNCFFELIGTKESKKAWKEMRVANRFKPGEVVFYEGEQPRGLFVVCTGRVKIYKSSRTGQQLTTRVESPGDLLGHISMLAQGPYTGTGEALDESVVSMIDERTFLNFLVKYPYSSLALLRALAHDVRRGENKARDIAFKPARGRLAETLLRMTRAAKPHPLVAGLKRKDLAEMSGLTIETTVRLLNDFEQRGLIKKKDKDLAILNEAQLKALAGASA